MAKKESTIFEQKQREANIALKEFWAANSAVIDPFAVTEWSAKSRIQYTTVRTWLQPETSISSRNGGIMEVQDLLAFLKTKVPVAVDLEWEAVPATDEEIERYENRLNRKSQSTPTETAGILNEPVIPETFNLNQ